MSDLLKNTDFDNSVHLEYAPRSHAHEGRILHIAARSMNVHVGQEEKDYWRVASQTAAALDTLVDEEGWRDISPLFDTVMSDEPRGIEGVITDEQAYELAEFYNHLPQERQDTWRAAAFNLPVYADNKAEASNIEKLVDVTLGEAEEVFSQVFQLDTSGKLDEIPRKKFNRWLTHFARAGYTIDASLDMPRDYETGIIQVEPSFSNRVEMLFAARTDMPRCFMIGRRAVFEFAKTGLATVKERSR